MTDNVPRSPETPDVLPDISQEALLGVLKSKDNAFANSVRSVILTAQDRTEKYSAFGSAPQPPRKMS